jgi:hypothetical protein
VALDLPHRQAAGIERDDLVVEAIQAGLALGHDLRLESGVAVAWHVDLDRPVLGQHRLGVRSIAVVAGAAARRIALLVAQMVRQLGPKDRGSPDRMRNKSHHLPYGLVLVFLRSRPNWVQNSDI